MEPEILSFKENIHTALWGVESWQVSSHKSSPSVIDGGEWNGRALDEACPGFPLLTKIIDAKTRLSVQVHPNERTASLTGGEPKTEMWCLLSDGFIYAGLKPGTGAAEIADAVASGRFEELLVRHDAKAGDVFFIPGGLVHAIGDNTRLFEVQQSSNTTYRLYDWGRVGANGKPRALHVAKSLKTIDYSLPAPEPLSDVDCPFFSFRKLHVDGSVQLPARGYVALFAVSGSATANGVLIPTGRSVLARPGVSVTLTGSAEIYACTAR